MSSTAEIVTIATPENGTDSALKLSGLYSEAKRYILTSIDHPDGKYRFSVWAKAAAAMSVYIEALGEGGTFEVTTGWQRIEMAIDDPSGNLIEIWPLADTDLYLYKSQLETGDMVTGWVSAEEDTSDRLHSGVFDLDRNSVAITDPTSGVSWRVNSSQAGFYDSSDNLVAGVGADSLGGYLAANRLANPSMMEWFARIGQITSSVTGAATWGLLYTLMSAGTPDEYGGTFAGASRALAPVYDVQTQTVTEEPIADVMGMDAIGRPVELASYEEDGEGGYTQLCSLILGQPVEIDLGSSGQYRATDNCALINTHLLPTTLDHLVNATSGGGGVQISTPLLGCYGYPWEEAFAGVFHTVSDRARKKDIAPIDADEAVNLVMGLRPVTYKFRAGIDETMHMGFIAQDVRELVGDGRGVVGGPEGHMALAYDELIAPLVSLVQQQQRMITMLTGRCEALEERVLKLEGVLDRLTNDGR